MTSTEFVGDSELELDELVELVEGTVDDIKDFVSEQELTENDIDHLITAEEAAKNRKTALEFLKRKKHEFNVEEHVEDIKDNLKEEHGQRDLDLHNDAAEIDIGLLKLVLAPNKKPFLTLEIGNHTIPLKDSSLNRVFMETGLKTAPVYTHNAENTDFTAAQPIQQNGDTGRLRNGQNTTNRLNNNGLNAESSVDPVNHAGLNQSKVSENSSENVETKEVSEREKIEQELSDKFNLDKDDFEGKTLPELKELKKELSEKKKLKKELKEKYGLTDAEVSGKTLDKLNDLKDRLDNKSALKQEIKDKFGVNPGDRSLEELRDYKESLMTLEDKKKDLLNRFDISESRLEGLDLQGLKELETELKERDDLINRLKAYGYEEDELNDKDFTYLKNQIDEIDQKKSIIEDLEADFDDEKLKEIDISDLRALKNEKMEREQIISDLVDEGMNEDDLRNSSTKDLRKLRSEMLAPENNSKNGNDDVSDEEISKIEEEAEEELEMLMGVVEEAEDKKVQEESESTLGKLKELKNELGDLVQKQDGKVKSDKDLIREDKVLNLLEDYKSSDNHVKKAIKTAQVMKGYVEYKLGVKRELTYQELSDKINGMAEEQENHDLSVLGEFFGRIHHQIYSGNVYVEDIDNVIDCSERIIEASK